MRWASCRIRLVVCCRLGAGGVAFSAGLEHSSMMRVQWGEPGGDIKQPRRVHDLPAIGWREEPRRRSDESRDGGEQVGRSQACGRRHVHTRTVTEVEQTRICADGRMMAAVERTKGRDQGHVDMQI